MDRGTRKKSARHEEMVQAAKEEVLPGYEEYLVLLQERNKLLKRLRKKNKSQIDLERKEHGFSLYVNGPHKDGKFGPKASTPTTALIPTQPKTARKPKTAGDARNPHVLDQRALDEITREQLEKQRERDRARTAPNARERRRNWNMNSVEIKTTTGDRRKVKAPDILSGRYADDFEDDDSDEIRSSASENTDDDDNTTTATRKKKTLRKPPPPRESDMFNSEDSYNSADEENRVSRHMSAVLYEDSDEDIEIDANKFQKKTSSSPRKPQRSSKPGRPSIFDTALDHNEKLMLSMTELKTLNQSLGRNATIRESLAREVSSEEEDFVPESPIPELEEGAGSDDGSHPQPSPRVNLHPSSDRKPPETIVLEFGGGQSQGRKVERNLSAARKKDVEDDGSTSFRRRPGSAGHNTPVTTPRAPVRTQSAKTLTTAEGPRQSSFNLTTVAPSSRPLSSNRKTAESAWQDTDADASAVMAALRAENEQASRFNKEDKQPPRKRPKDPIPQPVYDRSELPPKIHQLREPDTGRDSGRRSPLVSPGKIEQIMQKVLKMTPKHQRRLVKMLGKIEQSMVGDSLDSPDDRARPTGQPRKSAERPLRASRSSVTKRPTVGSNKDKNVIEVHMEVTSNWGHAMRLGLTEIQLYHGHKSLVPISPGDVTVYGAEECKGTTDVLFNGKFKSNKERNMWSCRYHNRRPVEFTIRARNPHPDSGEPFTLSQMKLWNFNKSINDLDVGVKDVKVFVGSDLVFTGPVEKGCGNQVFDYCHVIPLVPKPVSPVIPESDVKINGERAESPEAHEESEYIYPVRLHSLPKPDNKKAAIVKTGPKSTAKSSSRDKVSAERPARIAPDDFDRLQSPITTSNTRPPVSPRGQRSPVASSDRSPSPAPRFPIRVTSPRAGNNVNHRSISPSPGREHKKTIRSISMSSQSSASSGGESLPSSRAGSRPVSEGPEKHARSETRTLNYQGMDRKLNRPSVGSDSETDDGAQDGPSVSKAGSRRRAVRTPRKSKRMAARLDGHSSTEVESSKSVSESAEHRPPLPQRKSDEKLNRKALAQKALEDNLKKQVPDAVSEVPSTHTKSERVGNIVVSEPDIQDSLDEALRASGNGPVQVGSSVSVTSSQDDTPMLQKLKDMNKKDQSSTRKKEIPRWLKGEDVSAPFDNPPESRSGNRVEPRNKSPVPAPTPDEINMLIDEELSMFPEKKTEEPQPQPTAADTADEGRTPMERIQKNRSKWRENPSLNLEESWGSLSQFNQQQRGRLSLDMGDDVLDEYINKIAGPAEPTIEEEPQQEAASGMDIEIDDFVIPELPHGRELVVNILSTWGDKHYVGLTGIEIFTSTGEMVTVSKIFADPEDINILAEYKKDPRVVKNLIDGVCRTRDDVHMWLAPFVQGQNHLVFITFDIPVKIALIRIWNYNKSRIHSYRGAKDVMIALDSNLIFTGEIARACGALEGGTEAFGDTILFTTDEGILEAVSQHDEAFEGDIFTDDEPFDVERPATADDGGSANRPFTRAVGNIGEPEREATSLSLAREVSMATFEGDILVYKGSCLELNFTATWGDHHYMGLTGLEVVGKDGEALPVTINMLTANPRDVTSLPGHDKDDRTLEKVINGTNVSTLDDNMWLVPFTEGQNHTLQIDFGQKVLMAGLRIWNYNKSKEDTYRGAKIIHVSINGRTISPPEGFLVRKGPGNCHFDFAQEISFSPDANKDSNMASSVAPSNGSADQNYEVVQMPCGFIYQLQLFSTWGDPYYVGLNGIEFYGADLKKIEMTESNISAYPDSVNVLEKAQGDARTPDKLIDGANDTMDGGHMWLAPILPSMLNRVYVIFDQPTSVSMIKVWNYSKTCNRGTKDFALLVDDLLVYNGELQPVPQTARGILPNCEGTQPYHTILFTDNKDVQRREKFTIINNQKGEQDVQMTNDKKVVSHYNDPKKAHEGKPVDQTLRPTTSVIYSKSKKRR